MTKQERIERVLRNNGTKGFNMKQLAFYAKVEVKTLRTRISKMKAKELISEYKIESGKVTVSFAPTEAICSALFPGPGTGALAV